ELFIRYFAFVVSKCNFFLWFSDLVALHPWPMMTISLPESQPHRSGFRMATLGRNRPDLSLAWR
ncbi:hypothetical protein Dimus_026834, partial [Dionaea muscipula]